ncbi:MAG: type I 3-dehydroquinate dehydratase [Thermoplasmata archaeon]
MPERPLLVVTLTSRSLGPTAHEIEDVVLQGAEVAEVRFDRWTPSDLDRAGELLPSKIPLLATYRSRSQGGEGTDAPEARLARLRKLSRLPFAYLDVEVQSDGALLEELSARPPSARLVLSHHAPSTNATELRGLAQLSRPLPDAILKVAVEARTSEAIQVVLPIARELPRPFVAMTVGPSGPLFRAWSARLGCALVFCAPSSEGFAARVESSQLPVDLLRRFLLGDANAPLFAVVGNPVTHSRSPDLHNAWIEADGRQGIYLALGVRDDEELREVASSLAGLGFRGLNVTHPLKFGALRLADESGPEAIAAGCANTLTFQSGTIRADNTDVIAVRRRLLEIESSRLRLGRVTIIGTGGAARATLVAASDLGIPTEILGRDGFRVAHMAREFGAEVGSPGDGSHASLIVQATPVGRQGAGSLPWTLQGRVGAGTHVVDFVYGADDPTLASQIRQWGGTYEDGRRLLVYQAAASYERWWGAPPGADQVARALEVASCGE